jgi:hypothetical protein
MHRHRDGSPQADGGTVAISRDRRDTHRRRAAPQPVKRPRPMMADMTKDRRVTALIQGPNHPAFSLTTPLSWVPSLYGLAFATARIGAAQCAILHPPVNGQGPTGGIHQTPARSFRPRHPNRSLSRSMRPLLNRTERGRSSSPSPEGRARLRTAPPSWRLTGLSGCVLWTFRSIRGIFGRARHRLRDLQQLSDPRL